MKQLLIRADDIGYSYAVDLGIARAVHDGLVRSVGVMPNMPETARGVSWIADADIAIGQHTNVCLGRPCADPARIPSLLGADGCFHSSREFREHFKAGEELVDYDEACIEIRAQHDRFVEIVGREPDYFEAHAVLSKNLNQAIHDVAADLGLREQVASFDPMAVVTCANTPVRMVMGSMAPDYDPAAFIRSTVEAMTDGETVVVVCHPGYLDNFILQNSSLTTPRVQEVDALIDPELRAWLEAQPGLRPIDYRDL
ncbi:ChbG/HpnK family deacetylase [Paratractidigestivibacter sp.]|uniref:ChbG/HpnK family deacetylase n=1 Tax=Paratractidigestivibacter sp. TaxID=2847316 RepID=UPI002AC9E962|nr:ChbG/HpnK family deacetylase [Paratractidigestivibacter sp.]